MVTCKGILRVCVVVYLLMGIFTAFLFNTAAIEPGGIVITLKVIVAWPWYWMYLLVIYVIFMSAPL